MVVKVHELLDLLILQADEDWPAIKIGRTALTLKELSDS